MNLRQLTVYEHFGWGHYARYNFLVDQSSWRRLVVRIVPLAEVIGLIRWILGQISNFHDEGFFGRGEPHPHLGVRYQGSVNL